MTEFLPITPLPAELQPDKPKKRQYSRDEPVALDDRDPGNSDITELVEPLSPDDNVFTLVNPDQGDLRETAPMHDPTHGS